MALQPGQRLVRREPQNDDWDDVTIGGLFEMGESGTEFVIAPTGGFAAPVTATPESILRVYTIDTDPPKLPEWITPANEVTVTS